MSALIRVVLLALGINPAFPPMYEGRMSVHGEDHAEICRWGPNGSDPWARDEDWELCARTLVRMMRGHYHQDAVQTYGRNRALWKGWGYSEKQIRRLIGPPPVADWERTP